MNAGEYDYFAAMSRSYAIQYAADRAALKEEGNDMDQNDYYYSTPRQPEPKSARVASLATDAQRREPDVFIDLLSVKEISAVVGVVLGCVAMIVVALVVAW